MISFCTVSHGSHKRKKIEIKKDVCYCEPSIFSFRSLYSKSADSYEESSIMNSSIFNPVPVIKYSAKQCYLIFEFQVVLSFINNLLYIFDMSDCLIEQL